MAAIALSGVACAQTTAAPAQAEAAAPGPTQSLREALVKTYRTNPTLMAERQSLRALDESVAIARAAGRPQLSAHRRPQPGRRHPQHRGRQRPRLQRQRRCQRAALFAGGRIRNSVRAADTRVEAGRADLRATEGDIFTEAVAAYMDVIRDRSIVQLNQQPGPRPRDQFAGDPRPLRGRRPDPHRRRPVRRAARARAQQPRHSPKGGSRRARRITGA